MNRREFAHRLVLAYLEPWVKNMSKKGRIDELSYDEGVPIGLTSDGKDVIDNALFVARFIIDVIDARSACFFPTSNSEKEKIIENLEHELYMAYQSRFHDN